MFEEQLEEEREFKTTKIYQEKRAGAVFYVNLWQHELFFHNVKLNFSSNSENKYNLFKFAVLICQKTGFDLSYKDFFKPPSNKNFIEQNEILRESVLQYKKAFDEILLTAVKKQKKNN